MILYDTTWEVNDSFMQGNELEEQRPGRNKKTAVNKAYINSGAYRRKFDELTDSDSLNRLLYQLAKKMLDHRAGTKFEDMYWIDIDTEDIIAEETTMTVEEEIIYSKATIKAIGEHDNIITIHTHPSSSPPSAGDLNANFSHEYQAGVIVCHNGDVYLYASDEMIDDDYFSLTIAEYLNQGYNEREAHKKAIEEMCDKFDINVKEVTGDDTGK